jgi:hypothetical protein
MKGNGIQGAWQHERWCFHGGLKTTNFALLKIQTLPSKSKIIEITMMIAVVQESMTKDHQ